MDRHVSDEQGDELPDTQRQPSRGSIDTAEEHRGWCMRTADALDERASAIARLPGRPDSMMERIAEDLRGLAKRFEAWWTPAPGEGFRSSPVERAEDLADLTKWGNDAIAALEAHPAPE
jgi:hypothetical protein